MARYSFDQTCAWAQGDFGCGFRQLRIITPVLLVLPCPGRPRPPRATSERPGQCPSTKPT